MQPFRKGRHIVVSVSARRSTMRLWGLVVVTGGFLFPFSLLAQHAASPASSHVSPAVSHVSSGPSAGIRTSSIPSSRNLGATPANRAQGLHTYAQTARAPKATSMKDKGLSQSVANSGSERRGLFSFLRRRGSVQAGLQSKCKHGRCSIDNASSATRVAATAEVAPGRSEARSGCTVVPIANPGVPCNVLAPCCP